MANSDGSAKVGEEEGRKSSSQRLSSFSVENTKTELHSVPGGRRTATLYLSRTHSVVINPRSTPRPSDAVSTLAYTRSRNNTQLSELTHDDCRPRFSRESQSQSQPNLTSDSVDRLDSVLNDDADSNEAADTVGELKSSTVKPKYQLQKEFTFTGYNIEDDVKQPDEEPSLRRVNGSEVSKDKHCGIYLESCRRLGIQPLPLVLASIDQPSMNLKTAGLGVQGARALSTALVKNSHVKAINLEENWIGADGAVSIAEMTLGNNALTEINIAENLIGTEGIRAISESLEGNRCLRKLDVSGSNLSDHDAKYISRLLESNVTLQELRARHNKFGEIGGVILAPSIAKNEFLSVLDLSWNHLRGRGAISIAASIGENVGLKTINLSWNGFCNQACSVLGGSLMKNRTLKELDLSDNRVHHEAVVNLMKGVQKNQTLTSLKLGRNPYTPDVATVILQACLKSESNAIRTLDLTDIVVDENFTKIHEEASKSRVLRVKHGRVIKSVESVMTQSDGNDTIDPVKALYDYMAQEGYRVIDLFNRFDTDNSMSVTRDEFLTGLVQANVPLTVGQLEDLIDQLDDNKDGQVDLRELMEGEKYFRRKLIKKKMREQAQEKREAMIRKRTESVQEIIPEGVGWEGISSTD